MSAAQVNSKSRAQLRLRVRKDRLEKKRVEYTIRSYNMITEETSVSANVFFSKPYNPSCILTRLFVRSFFHSIVCLFVKVA